MAQAISFSGYRPSPRYDSIPWTDVQIEEGATSSGPWTVIDTIALSPVDSNPAVPMWRDFTTELASDTPGLWYRVTFLDATADSSQPTNPVQNTEAGVAPGAGPCTDWISGADVAAVCSALDTSGDPSVYDGVAHTASEILWAASGRQFSGYCGPVTVRPCVPNCGCWTPGRDWQWSWGYGYWLGGGGNGVSAVQDCVGDAGCCGYLSRVKLSGYPVTAIDEVKIDGTVVDSGDYRLDGYKWLTYLEGPNGLRRRWPSCQNLSRPDTEAGTFSVTYTHGILPPQIGLDAAVQLACALATSGACDLPAGASRVARQGITIEMGVDKNGIPVGLAGLSLVQLFLNAYNPSGLRRRTAVWSPDVQRFAQRVG